MNRVEVAPIRSTGSDVAGTDDGPGKAKAPKRRSVLRDRFWAQDEESCDCHPGGWRATRRYGSAYRRYCMEGLNIYLSPSFSSTLNKRRHMYTLFISRI